MIRVLIVEDQRMIREMLEQYLRRENGYNVCEALERAEYAPDYCFYHRIDLVIMDICTEGKMNGFEASAQIKQKKPNTKIVAVTSMLDGGFLACGREKGVDSMWYKDLSAETLISFIERTMKGEQVYPDKVPEITIGDAVNYDFTKGEIRVLRLLVQGKTYKEIAAELNISPDTVKEHVSNMLSKTGFKSKLQLTIEVVSKKMIVPNV